MSKEDTLDRRSIVEALERLVTPGIKLTALADQLGLRKQDYARLRATMLTMVEDGVARVLPGGAFALAPSGRPLDKKAAAAAAQRAAASDSGDGAEARTSRPARATRTPPPRRTGKLPWKAAAPAAAPTA